MMLKEFNTYCVLLKDEDEFEFLQYKAEKLVKVHCEKNHLKAAYLPMKHSPTETRTYPAMVAWSIAMTSTATSMEKVMASYVFITPEHARDFLDTIAEEALLKP